MGSLQNRQHSFVGEHYIFHFGEIKVYEDSQGNQFFTEQYTFIVDQNAETEFINHLRRKNNQCPYLTQIRHISLNRDNYCSNSAKISVVFEFLPYTLKNLLQRKQNFTEAEILRIFYCLIQAVKYLNQIQSYHGDISPQFIYCDNKSKYLAQQLGDSLFKIFDSSYFKPFLNGYYRAQKQKTYSAPEVLANLGEKRVFPLYNHHTADTFSVGLVVLQCLSLADPLGAYSNNYEIDFYYIQSMLRLAQRKEYSPDLIGLVRECVQQRNRPDIGVIAQKFQNLKLKQRMQCGGMSHKLSLKRRGSWSNTHISTKQFEPRVQKN